MESRFVNIMKQVWKNPIVQFSCFTLLEWVLVLFHKNTNNKFNHSKNSDACSQDYSIGTSEDMSEHVPETKTKKKSVKVEKESKLKKSSKKIIDKLEEPTLAQPEKETKKKSSTTKTKKTSTKKKSPDKD